MSIWSAIAANPEAWHAPDLTVRNDGAKDSGGDYTRDWAPLALGTANDAERAALGYKPGDPLYDALQRQYAQQYASQAWANSARDSDAGQAGLATAPADPFDEWLRQKGYTLQMRRTPGTNNSEVRYVDANGNPVGQSMARHASPENDFLAGGALLAAPALAALPGWAAATGGMAGNTAGAAGGLAGVDLGALPATSAGVAEGGAATGGAMAPSGLTAAQLDLAAGTYGPSFAATVPEAVTIGGSVVPTGAAAAGGLAGLVSSAGNALEQLATPGNLLKIGSTLGGALIGSNSANQALKAQQRSTDAALAEQRRQYDQTRADLYGARDLSRTDLLGGQRQSRADLTQGMDRSRADLNQGLSGALGDYAPYQQAGRQALAQYQQALAKPVTAADVMADPGYQFGLQQGQLALDRKTAAMGGRVSGAALKAASRYGTDYASTGYNAAYQRRQDSLNRLAQLAGMGQQAAGQAASARLGTAGSLSSGALGTAGAMSSGSLGTAGQLGQGQFQAAGGAANAGANRANAISDLVTSQGNAMGGAALAQGNIWANAGNQLAALYNRRQNPYGYPGP
jgi:hypothetical protein